MACKSLTEIGAMCDNIISSWMIGDPLPKDIGIVLPNEDASGWYVFRQEIFGPKRLALGFVPSVATAG